MLLSVDETRQSATLDFTGELRTRMAKPQRHRLLHGFPLAAAMPEANISVKRAARSGDPAFQVRRDQSRGLLVGVLPHPFCNPAVAGCGFCTFPHESYGASKAAAVVRHVSREIDARVCDEPDLFQREVSGLYFGGGTANLAPPEAFRELCETLDETFDFSQAEVTLEGVPGYFVRRKPLLVDIMREEIAARHYRISMGIQTFSERRLSEMGRLAFGTASIFAEVVELAHARGMTVSADMLFDLPGQTLAEMKTDLRRAVDIGLDHLGLYHLVMFRGLGTPWSRDERILSSLPSNTQAADNWLALRELLYENGFHQTTLTNFERDEYDDSPRRFQYEELSFQPERFDLLGFGPSGISFTSASGADYALKTMNPGSHSEYISAVKDELVVWDRYYQYQKRDLQILYLTRWLAALHIDRDRYEGLFGSDPVGDFAGELAALEEEQLIDVRPDSIVPTDRGIFYADSIAALLASRHLHALRNSGRHRSRIREVTQHEASAGHCLPVPRPEVRYDGNDNVREFM